MADIQVDPELLRVRATQLGALADGLAVLPARLRGTAGGAAVAQVLGAGIAARHAELISALDRDVEELARLAQGLRREADAVTECDQSARLGLSRIAIGLAGVDGATSECGLGLGLG